MFKKQGIPPASQGDSKREASCSLLLSPVFIETICFHYFNQWCYYVYSLNLYASGIM